MCDHPHASQPCSPLWFWTPEWTRQGGLSLPGTHLRTLPHRWTGTTGLGFHPAPFLGSSDGALCSLPTGRQTERERKTEGPETSLAGGSLSPLGMANSLRPACGCLFRARQDHMPCLQEPPLVLTTVLPSTSCVTGGGPPRAQKALKGWLTSPTPKASWPLGWKSTPGLLLPSSRCPK